jgi:hypothetical protein
VVRGEVVQAIAELAAAELADQMEPEPMVVLQAARVVPVAVAAAVERLGLLAPAMPAAMAVTIVRVPVLEPEVRTLSMVQPA